MAEVDQNPKQFTVEYLVTKLGEGGAQHQALSLPPIVALGTRTPTPAATHEAPPEPMAFATPRTADSTLGADHDDFLAARYRKIEDLLGEGEPLGLATRELEEEVAELHAISTDEPNSFVEAERNPCWLKQCKKRWCLSLTTRCGVWRICRQDTEP